MRLLLVACFAVALDGTVSAQQHADTIGASSCAKYANMYRMRPEDADQMFLAWAQGYISGANSLTPEFFFDLNAKTPGEMRRYLRQYCNAHPLADYTDGVWELMKSLPTVKRGN